MERPKCLRCENLLPQCRDGTIELTAFAASANVTAELVNLTGLAQTGLEYV
jgi:hypothetical protein